MWGRRKKHPLSTLIRSWLGVGCVLVLCIFLGRSVYERFVVERDMAERRAAAEEDLRELRERKEVLQEKVDYLEDERGVESEIRTNFDVAKEGEQVVIIIDDKEIESGATTSIGTNEEEDRGLWSFLPW